MMVETKDRSWKLDSKFRVFIYRLGIIGLILSIIGIPTLLIKNDLDDKKDFWKKVNKTKKTNNAFEKTIFGVGVLLFLYSLYILYCILVFIFVVFSVL